MLYEFCYFVNADMALDFPTLLELLTKFVLFV